MHENAVSRKQRMCENIGSLAEASPASAALSSTERDILGLSPELLPRAARKAEAI